MRTPSFFPPPSCSSAGLRLVLAAVFAALGGCDGDGSSHTRMFDASIEDLDGSFEWDGNFDVDADIRPDDEDDDDDGFPDVTDNCPALANPSQTDDDRDGLGNQCDNCPQHANLVQEDGDHDGIGDLCESDIFLRSGDNDGDGVLNQTDLCPLVADPDQLDSDRDGKGDLCDNCPATANANQTDTDGDGRGDVCQAGEPGLADDDGDTVPDANDNCRGISNPLQEDTDHDSRGDACDNCPSIANYQQRDTDHDGLGDMCEQATVDPNGDDDEDGVPNRGDNCPLTPNGPNAGSNNQLDSDKDRVGDSCDNCVSVANAAQDPGPLGGPVGANGLPLGSACQPRLPGSDRDGDGTEDDKDNCPGIANDQAADKDKDTVGDACDNCPDVANYVQLDLNANGLGDRCEGLHLDNDKDGIPDVQDKCPLLASADNGDTDGDGLGNPCDNCPLHANPGQEDLTPPGTPGGTAAGSACEPLVIPADNSCEGAASNANVVRPNLVFVLDESWSMTYSSGAAGSPSREAAWHAAIAPGAGNADLSGTLGGGNFNLAVAGFKSPLPRGDTASCNALPTLDTANLPLSTPENYTASCPFATFAECFHDRAQLDLAQFVPYTPTTAALRGTLDPNRDNNANDALFLLANDPDNARRKKAVLLVTDGVPTSCPDALTNDTGPRNASMRQAIDAARAIATTDTDPGNGVNRVPVYVLGFSGVSEDMMQLLANAGDPSHPGPFQVCDNTVQAYATSCICNDEASADGPDTILLPQTLGIGITDVGANGTRYRPIGCTNWKDVRKSTWYPLRNAASIAAAVNAVIARTASCDLTLVDNAALSGNPNPSLITVTLSGATTATTNFGPDPSNGWSRNGNLIRLNGSACAALDAAVNADPSARVEVRVACACSGASEICGDLRDNNCNGQADEGCKPPPTICGVDAPPSECPVPNCTPQAEICDGDDDDCDGHIDDGCPDDDCTNPALELCGDEKDNDCDGKIDDDCPPMCVAAPEICNGKDDNCDDAVDEGCEPPACIVYTEICDGQDDDCDGMVDDMCLSCVDPRPEICDELDNDCDGMIDEGCPGVVLL